MYLWVRQTVMKKHQELNFLGSCASGVLEKFLASCKPNVASEETWMSKAFSGIKEKKNPDSNENLIENHKKKLRNVPRDQPYAGKQTATSAAKVSHF